MSDDGNWEAVSLCVLKIHFVHLDQECGQERKAFSGLFLHRHISFYVYKTTWKKKGPVKGGQILPWMLHAITQTSQFPLNEAETSDDSAASPSDTRS